MSKTSSTEKQDLELLDHIQYVLEREISNYALEEVEDCYDEDQDSIVRGFRWGRGNKNYWIVIEPCGLIRYTESSIHMNLIVQIHNALMTTMMEIVDIAAHGLEPNRRLKTKRSPIE